MTVACCFGRSGALRAADAEPSTRAASDEAQLVALRVGDAPSVTPAAQLTLARKASVRAQWAAAAAAPPTSGKLARHETPYGHEADVARQEEALRRKFSLAAALAPAAQLLVGRSPAALLRVRLGAIGLQTRRVAGDGNCQFRALAHALTGSDAAHGAVRAFVVAHLRAQARTFLPLFEGAAAFEAYCADMAQPATWGDELTLAAAADAFSVHVHVVQDTPENWHLCYSPAPPSDDVAGGRKTRRVFVAYTAPVHYDAIVLAP